MAKDNEFYKRMMEAKKRKKEATEREQLEAEFQAHPERFNAPQPIIVKTDADLKLDAAFQQLQAKLHQESPTKQDKFDALVQRLREESSGL